jgi:hypothetical protein
MPSKPAQLQVVGPFAEGIAGQLLSGMPVLQALDVYGNLVLTPASVTLCLSRGSTACMEPPISQGAMFGTARTSGFIPTVAGVGLLLRADVSFQLGPEIVQLSSYVSRVTIRPAAAAGLELVQALLDDLVVLESFMVLARLIDAYGNAAEPLGLLQATVQARIPSGGSALELGGE